jgi:hypothetical protein
MSRLTTAARICQEQGWAVGDTLEGSMEGSMEGVFWRMRITAIGESAILTRRPGAAEFTVWASELRKHGFRKVTG